MSEQLDLNDLYKELHGLTLKDLINQLKAGSVPASVHAQAIAFLKMSGFNPLTDKNPEVDDLSKLLSTQLPFSDNLPH